MAGCLGRGKGERGEVGGLAAHRGEEDWRFLVKLAFEAEAHAADAEAVDVTLLSAPPLVALEPGARAAHPTHRLSDWLVVTPHGDVGPDDAIALED